MVPWWVYLVVAGIVFSAYMTIRTGQEETQREEDDGEGFSFDREKEKYYSS